ncbi:MAG TPA: NAD(P)H-dependent glycerol-3-phosphate dehydrogenase [Steroidobacteraceae bacterium]|nr:NAD(P)H-dependent glycerol-3-phosphate dehydrogenase [Steroidobacteraceae bacterium]
MADQPGPQAGSPIAVLGAGSWGTALAIQFARSGKATRLWGRDPTQVAEMVRERANRPYLPKADFPESLSVGGSLGAQLAGALDALVVVPSGSFRDLLEQIRPLLEPQTRLAWATKGFEAHTGLLPHQVAREVLGTGRAFAVLSGPTFASEVGAGLPTAMTVASADDGFATALASDLSSANFRAYTSTDIAGVEVGGAVKNVLALAAGLADGLGFGANTRIALITRGLTEMVRLGVALGARRETFMGLAGLGDLVLSCTDDQSRNRRFGLLLARGQGIEQARAAIGQVVEGVHAARAVREVARRENVEMPLCEGVYRVLYEDLPADEVVRALMRRPIRAETD